MRFFNLDSPLMSALSRLADLMILNLLVLIFCIPVITIGPAITAMHFVLLKMVRKEECYIIAPFFKSFKENFRQTSISGLIIIAVVFIYVIDLRILNEAEFEYASWLLIALYACGIIGSMTLMYVFPLFARFNNTIWGTFKNALYMSILNLPRTVLMILACILPVLFTAMSATMFPILFLVGISGPAYLCAMLYSNTFKRFEPEEVQIDADAWSVDAVGDSDIETRDDE